MICASPLPLGIGRGKGGVGKPKQRRELYCAKRGCFCVVFVFWGGGGGWFTHPQKYEVGKDLAFSCEIDAMGVPGEPLPLPEPMGGVDKAAAAAPTKE